MQLEVSLFFYTSLNENVAQLSLKFQDVLILFSCSSGTWVFLILHVLHPSWVDVCAAQKCDVPVFNCFLKLQF